MRLLFIIILFVVSYLIVKSAFKKLDKYRSIGHSDADKKNKNGKTSMLKCDECGLHVPEHEAIKQGNYVFCSLEHAKARLE